MTDLWQQIVERWRQRGIAIRKGADAAAIERFEAKHSVVLPDDVREYFETVDGMDPYEMDGDMYHFWPLAEVKPVGAELEEIHPDRFAYVDCFVFADWSIWCWGYAVKLTDDASQPGPVVRVTGGSDPREELASSFRDFMERYVADPDSLL